MECPCKQCDRKGCGTYHDICPQYVAFAKWRERANARRYAEKATKNYEFWKRLRSRGKRR